MKLGQEPQSETAATRLLWAAGYFVDEDYYLAEFKVTGLPEIAPRQNFVSADGTVHRARLERKLKEVKKLGNWELVRQSFPQQAGIERLASHDVLVEQLGLERSKQLDLRSERGTQVSGQRRGRDIRKDRQCDSTRSKSEPNDYAKSKFIEKARVRTS